MQNDIVQDIAVLLSYTMQDLPDVEPLKSSIPEVKKDDLIIKNTMYKTPKLRKVHLELAEIKAMKILHCVFFPEPAYNLPIFGCDIVATDKVVTAAIVDISPISGFNYPPEIKEISDEYNMGEKRDLPSWAEEVFSPYCKFIRLTEDIDMANFYCLVMHYLKIYCEAVKSAKKGSMEEAYKRYQDQCKYCTQQRLNDKTRGILEKWFDKDWTDTYINDILFCKPKPMLTL